ncbi:MAG: hypothetical protein AB7V77_00355 [Candidatus Woesearchaeota archaeon]
MTRGRPSKSLVRDNIIELLFVLGKETAYNLHKYYVKLFPNTSRRNIYYQLQKGVVMELFEIENVVDEKGNFSWGTTTRKVYYKLGKQSNPKLNERIVNYFKKN